MLTVCLVTVPKGMKSAVAMVTMAGKSNYLFDFLQVPIYQRNM